jgi:glycosyltransferase involved in cell wall biosynthesis
LDKKTRVLIFAGFYKPAYKAGGPVQTISGIVESLADFYDFQVVTSDRDLGDIVPFETVNINEWNTVGSAKVLYLSPGLQNLSYYRGLFRTVPHDLVYLNSFFSWHFSICPLLAIRTLRNYTKPIIIAPRGEFSESALKIKSLKKNLFLRLCQLFRIHRNVVWQASSTHDIPLIERAMGRADLNIKVVPNIVRFSVADFREEIRENAKISGTLRICSVGRVSAIKNTDYAIETLRHVKGKVDFLIFGPIEDKVFYEHCQDTAASLPSNINVKFCGEVATEDVRSALKECHLFFSPTKGENFGHSIAEALSTGIPVLISDRTPWRDLRHVNAGWDLPLDNLNAFAETIQFCVDLNQDAYDILRKGALEFAKNAFNQKKTLLAQRALFSGSSTSSNV